MMRTTAMLFFMAGLSIIIGWAGLTTSIRWKDNNKFFKIIKNTGQINEWRTNFTNTLFGLIKAVALYRPDILAGLMFFVSFVILLISRIMGD